MELILRLVIATKQVSPIVIWKIGLCSQALLDDAVFYIERIRKSYVECVHDSWPTHILGEIPDDGRRSVAHRAPREFGLNRQIDLRLIPRDNGLYPTAALEVLSFLRGVTSVKNSRKEANLSEKVRLNARLPYDRYWKAALVITPLDAPLTLPQKYERVKAYFEEMSSEDRYLLELGNKIPLHMKCACDDHDAVIAERRERSHMHDEHFEGSDYLVDYKSFVLDGNLDVFWRGAEIAHLAKKHGRRFGYHSYILCRRYVEKKVGDADVIVKRLERFTAFC